MTNRSEWFSADRRTSALVGRGRELERLSGQAQRVLHLRFVEDWTQQQIADELGITQYHVSRLLNRYLGELRDRMAEAA